MNLYLRQQACELFPAKRQHGRLVPWQRPEVSLSVRRMWAAYAYILEEGRTVRLPRTLQGLAGFAQFRRAHRQYRTRSQQAKKAWFLDQVLEMETAANSRAADSSHVARVEKFGRAPSSCGRSPTSILMYMPLKMSPRFSLTFT